MNNLIHYFSVPHDVLRVFILAFSIFLFWNIENLFAVSHNYKKWKHALYNSFFVITALPVQLFLGWLLLKVLNYDAIYHYGVFNIFSINEHPLILLFATFIVLDFFEYIYHVTMHKVKGLWKFHLVHHTDKIVDASSTLREHPIETFIRLAFLLLVVFITGVPFWALMIRQFIQIIFNVFVHSNFRLSNKVDKIASLFFITPNIHHVHHHIAQPYTDSNYGDIFSIWDRIFGTYKKLDKNATVFGLDTYMEVKESENFGTLIKLPFQQYRKTPSTQK